MRERKRRNGSYHKFRVSVARLFLIVASSFVKAQDSLLFQQFAYKLFYIYCPSVYGNFFRKSSIFCLIL